jgi:hypothetical protein
LPSTEGAAAGDDDQDIITDKTEVTNGNEEMDDLATCRDKANVAIGSEESDALMV